MTAARIDPLHTAAAATERAIVALGGEARERGAEIGVGVADDEDGHCVPVGHSRAGERVASMIADLVGCRQPYSYPKMER